ncbi:MAG TPA: alpha/beta fold hydrolase [Myxococcales bacterium]|nr:alpha/beta fold hydrolase [Myxococcales bacterium]
MLAVLLALLAVPHERTLQVGALFAREVGEGPPILVVHGGPDFDHTYFLPDLDRLAGAHRLVYYDERGRGRSAAGVRPQDVTLESEMADLDAVRAAFGLEKTALLGHSWGALLAVEYALRHPERVSRLILMNPSPIAAADWRQFRNERVAKLGSDLARMNAIRDTPAFQAGDPDAVAAYYRIHFRQGLARPEDLDRLVRSLRASPTFTPEGILKARQIEARLYDQTWRSPAGYDPLPRLRALHVPALVILGDHDFFSREMTSHVAKAIPGARLVMLESCGHFPFLECPAALRGALADFFTQH